MLKSYEAVYEDGQVKWLDDKPPIDLARVIVTVLESPLPESDNPQVSKRRAAPASIAGKGRTLGNIVSPILEDEASMEQERKLPENDEPLLEDLGGSEPQAQDISRRRYSY